MSSRLSDEAILALGRWDRRYANLITSLDVADGRVIALIDTNGAQGDAFYGYLEWYRQDEQAEWHCGSGGNVLGEGRGWTSGIAYAHGQADTPRVTVEFEGARHIVPTHHDGWWLFATLAADPADPADPADLPRRVE